jgi:GntP family gluconate:H+ symporter
VHPVLILLLGMAAVIGGIVALRLNAFLALIGAALLVSLLSPGETSELVTRVAEAFGSMAGSLGIVIAAAAIIGNAMKHSGAADRIVKSLLSALGERRATGAFTLSGYILSIPVFFDTVFFLLVPLARSAYRRTRHGYLKYIIAIPAGGVATHALVPPTPGPLAAAGTLGVDLGVMIGVGSVIALFAAAAGLAFAIWADKHLPLPESIRDGIDDGDPLQEPTSNDDLPGLLPSLLPIILPVVLIAANTITSTMATRSPEGLWASVAPYAAVVGNANIALLASAVLAMWTYHAQRKPSRSQEAALVEESLMSAGVIILITAAGGAFGAMLRVAGIGPVIEGMFSFGSGSGVIFLFIGFAVASLLKIAQGSSTVAIVTTAAMMAAMVSGPSALPFNGAYLVAAIGAGAMVGSWMNDSGFWVFVRMSGLTEVEGLKTFTPVLAISGFAAMAATVVLSLLVPLT